VLFLRISPPCRSLAREFGLSRAARVSEQVSCNITQMLADQSSTFEIYNEERCLFPLPHVCVVCVCVCVCVLCACVLVPLPHARPQKTGPRQIICVTLCRYSVVKYYTQARARTHTHTRTRTRSHRCSVVKYIISLARTSLPHRKRLATLSHSLKARFMSADRRPVYEASAAGLSISIDREDVISSAVRHLGVYILSSCAHFAH
jgi:hypothetical protein